MKYRFALACCLLVWSAAACWSAPDPSKTTVSLDLKQTPLHQALNTLFESSGFQYSIAAEVPDPPITLKVHDMPFEQALRAIMRLGTTTTLIQGAGVVQRPVTYTKEGDLYQIGLRRDSPPPNLAELVGGVGGQGREASLEWAKIPVNFLRSHEAVAYLTQQAPQGIVSIQPLIRDNSLVVRGEHDAIQNLKQLLEFADVPALPLSVSAGISGPGLNGTPLAIRSMARSLIGNDVTIDEQATTSGQPAHMKVTLRTQLLGTGDLQITSDWDVSVPIAGGSRGPIRLVKRLSTTTRIPSGQQVSVAEVDLSGWGGKGVLRLWLRGEWGNAK
jgi:hypothetical protein